MPENFSASLFATMGFGDDEPAGGARADGQPLAIFYATESGNAEECAQYVRRQAEALGFRATITSLADASPAQLRGTERALFVVSTRSDEETPGDKTKAGRAPANALPFWHALNAPEAPSCAHMRFSVLALGDRSYRDFCAFGRMLDARLEALGAERVAPRVDCDRDYGDGLRAWTADALAKMAASLAPR
jgi:sulfite reductase (NADPH) flavoprotein alpha-component